MCRYPFTFVVKCTGIAGEYMLPMEEKRTEISTLGEFGLIDRIKSKFSLQRKSSLVGIGDDAAVIEDARGFDENGFLYFFIFG